MVHGILETREQSVSIPASAKLVEGDLRIPAESKGCVLFAHGSGSSRFSRRNRYVASVLNRVGLATLLIDLLTPDEEETDRFTAQLRFDIPLLADRLAGAVDWMSDNPEISKLPIGLFGASTGAAAALICATSHPGEIKAVVSRGGRPDLAESELPRVQCPTLLIVGDCDDVVIDLNRKALAQLQCIKRLELVPGATHLFEEPGTLGTAASLATNWFVEYLKI
jgi:putative phosphoribosyl transferase